ncbi:MAG: pyridoxal phosphate-dependent aminotransferase [gamma proteobacterium symbiont of Phacoides pectinatus]
MTQLPETARRMGRIQPFYVMELLARARELESRGRSIIHMEVGEPDFPTPRPVVRAGADALRDGHIHYTPAKGIPELRRAIADFYRKRYGVAVDPQRVVVTPGSSGALQLVMGALIDPGDEVLMADPSYPCNRHFAYLAGGEALAVPVGPETGYQLTPDLVERHWGERTKMVMVASPSNPTGTLLDPEALAGIHRVVRGRGGVLLVDEIYQGLTYGVGERSALDVADDLFVINSFSKYFGMTGWRLGWMVAPACYVDAVDRLAQNIFLSPPTVSQQAAMAAFSDDTLAILEERRRQFEARRDYLLPALRSLGFEIPATPRGAFYLYADCSRFTSDSFDFAMRLLEEEGVAVTPGKDFGFNRPHQHLRFAYTTGLDKLQEGIGCITRFIGKA